MNDHRAPDENRRQRTDLGLTNLGKEKRLYKKPAFRCERVFETQALSCGKTVSDTGYPQCQFSVKSS
jgi:hypothetical protein